MRKKIDTKIPLVLVLVAIIGICSFKIWGLPLLQSSSSPISPITSSTTTEKLIENEKPKEVIVIPEPTGLQYIEVVESCGPYYEEGPCVNVRSGPGGEHPIVMRLRRGLVLRAGEIVAGTEREWRRVLFDEWLRYPERTPKDLFVAEEYVRPFLDQGNQELKSDSEELHTKKIVIDRGDQKLSAYQGEELFVEIPVSTGLNSTPTPLGTFTIYRKMPSRYMQGPVPGLGDDYYDLPGVPWVMYFTSDGGAIHGTYWHNGFGGQWSHGCVNLTPEDAKMLYSWADVGTAVIVQD